MNSAEYRLPEKRINAQNILEFYELFPEAVERVFSKLEEIAKAMGEEVILYDMSKWGKPIDPKAANIEHDTCQSDGKTIYLHDNLEKIGGIVSRTYDLMHVGLGHGTQWAAGKDSGLQFAGDKAWEIASKAQVGATEEDLQSVHAYEEEAGRLGLQYLRQALSGVDSATAQKIVNLYNDYIQTDLAYIMQYYRTGSLKDFFENFQHRAGSLKEIQIPSNLEPKARENRCIPLIRRSE